jgi:predicted small metal-binding protein
LGRSAIIDCDRTRAYDENAPGHFLKETTMAKVLKCGDVVPGCKEEIKGDSEHDVLRKAAEHAKTAHHMDSIPPDVLSKVKGAIHDQGEPRTNKAGSSN